MLLLSSTFEFVKENGVVGLLIVLAVALVLHRDLPRWIREFFLFIGYRLFKIGSKQYIASKVGGDLSRFLRTQVTGLIPSASDFNVRVRWVTSPSDPVLGRDGTLILRLQETNDQTRNTLAAAKVALPHVICTTLRPRIQDYAKSAIDLALLHKLTEKLGRHARAVFQRHFLSPEVCDTAEVARLYRELLELDSADVFVPILLEELNLFGEALYESGYLGDKTGAILQFINYLLGLARRQVGEEIRLVYHSPDFHVGIVLLALSKKMRREGVVPYVKRVDRNVKEGCDTIYLVAFPPCRAFCQRLADALDGDQRLWVSSPVRGEKNGNVIVQLRRNGLFSDAVFAEKVQALGIKPGDMVKGTVMDVSRTVALVDVMGVNGTISARECSWQTTTDCAAQFHAGREYRFVVKSIDSSKSLLHLSCRLPEDDPWKSSHLPSIGDTIAVEVVALSGSGLLGRYVDGIEVIVPRDEVSWNALEPEEERAIVGTTQEVEIVEDLSEERKLVGSIRRLAENPWEEIEKHLPKGTELRATVRVVASDCVKVDLPGGLRGIIRKEVMLEAGHEYADFENCVVQGQGLHVVVSRVVPHRKRIHLTLKRVLRGK